MTAGVYRAAKRSTIASAGARVACASSTRWTILAMVLSAAVAVVRTRSVPPSRMEPANTGSPGPLVTGIGSPVMAASFAAATPSSTTPSTAMRSPGRATTVSPTAMSAAGTASSTPSRSDGRDRRRELHEPGDGPSRAVERRRLQHGAETEEEGDEARLGPLADRHRADHGKAHEDVHVDLPGAQREEGGAGDEAAAEDGRRRRRGRAPPRSAESSAAKPATTRTPGREDEAGAPVGQPEAAAAGPGCGRRVGGGRRRQRRPGRPRRAARPCRTPCGAPSGRPRRGRSATGR